VREVDGGEAVTEYLCIARGSVLRGLIVNRLQGWPWTQRSALVMRDGRLYVVVRRTLRRQAPGPLPLRFAECAACGEAR
jgi:hypothetical protein